MKPEDVRTRRGISGEETETRTWAKAALEEEELEGERKRRGRKRKVGGGRKRERERDAKLLECLRMESKKGDFTGTAPSGNFWSKERSKEGRTVIFQAEWLSCLRKRLCLTQEEKKKHTEGDGLALKGEKATRVCMQTSTRQFGGEEIRDTTVVNLNKTFLKFKKATQVNMQVYIEEAVADRSACSGL